MLKEQPGLAGLPFRCLTGHIHPHRARVPPSTQDLSSLGWAPTGPVAPASPIAHDLLGDIPSAASTIGPAHCTNAASFSSMPASICVMRTVAAERPDAADDDDDEVAASW